MATAEVAVGAPPRTASERIVRFIQKTPVHVALLAISVIWLIPTVGLAVTSFRPRGEIQSSSWWSALTDWSFTLHNYDLVLNNAKMGSSFVSSLIITIPSTILPLTIAALAAYAFSWIAFPFRDTIFLLIVALMVVPIQMALVPLLILFRDLGIADWYVGIWLAHTAFGLPLGIFVQNSDLWPMTIRINQMQSTYGIEWHLLSAGAFLLMIVPLIVFFALQRYFVQGLLAGSVK